ncbi:unnamed protein product [Rangifer tarandus platyrhynchus]|uniref:Uncharacterized protein n=2 Tax=Rangifer tarandus platyrhynchus TaxID=3082113 RepID=A0ACB0EFF6_RANTA|nr:unnamed protein product [Rangifer tarandus platyrhynchus]CAI9699099.1 unnamed protein product [Rangifer tarandus platyrhynchus]
MSPPPPAPTRVPAATPRSQPPEEHKAPRGQRPRHPGARPRQGARGSAGGGEPRSQPLRSLAHRTGGLAGQRAGRTRDARPLTVRAGLRAPIPPGHSQGSAAGAHRGRGAPPGQPQGCIGSNWRRFLLFLSSRPPAAVAASWEKGKKEKVLGSSCWKVSAKPPPSAAVPPKSTPSPDEAAAAARASCTHSRRMLGPPAARPRAWWLLLVPERVAGPPKGRLTFPRAGEG